MEYDLNFTNELIVDNFAGGGGASIGIEAGANRFVDIAINHDEKAISVHKLNHPHTKHIKSDVFEVDPEEVCEGRPVGFAWFSPDCTHFSKAKGGKPVKSKVRGLAWVARKWAKNKKTKPRVIILENVEQFLSWGPLVKKKDKSGNVVLDKYGEIEMMADPKRKGLTFWAFNQWFLRNGYKTEWKVLKASDYGSPTSRERMFWIARCDSEPIVWPEPTHGPKNTFLVKKKKLKPYRTASECIDFSIPCPSIFMTKNECKIYNKKNGTQIKRPLVEKSLTRLAKGTVKFVLKDPNPYVIPFIGRQFGQSVGSSIYQPIGSVTSGGGGKTQLVSPVIARQFKSGICHSVKEPLATIMANGGGGKNQLISAFLAKNYTGVVGSSLKDPIGTITAIDHHFLVTATLSQKEIHSGAERVFAFLMKYYGKGLGQGLKEPLHTLSTKDRFALVTVHVKGEPHLIVDIGMRMFQPHELLIAQGFPPDYNLGENTKTDKVRLIGNSVPPPFAEALVKANYNTLGNYRRTA